MTRPSVRRACCVLLVAALSCLLGRPALPAQSSAAQAPAAPQKQTLMLPMRDGTRLATDVYLPAGKGPFPTLLIRTPYNKDASASAGPSGNARGYAVVVQDTRGRFASQGANLPFDGDGWWDSRWDGYDTLEWIAKQPWCNGKIGSYGNSAAGITQYLAAGSGSKRIAAQVVNCGSPSMYFDTCYPGGVFKVGDIEGWLRITKHSPDSIRFWTKHGDFDEFWQKRDLDRRYRLINAATLHIGGWYDIFSQGTIDAFLGYQTHGGPGARGKQKLVMGPWNHGSQAFRDGEFTFPNGKTPPNRVKDTYRWLDHWMRGVDNGIDRAPAVTYYTMGDTSDPSAPGNAWRTSATWPPPGITTKPLYLSQDHMASAAEPGKAASLTYTYDPSKPCPTIGGPHMSADAGPADQRKIEVRPDVLVFTSPTLKEPVEVTGRVRARLWISSDCPDTDFFVRLCDVYPDGRSMNICEGQLRARFREGFTVEHLLTAGVVYPLTVDLFSTSMVFNRGHCIRIDVTSSSYPGYDPNPNTGAPFRANDEKRIAHNTVYFGGKHASTLILPVAKGALPRWNGL